MAAKAALLVGCGFMPPPFGARSLLFSRRSFALLRVREPLENQVAQCRAHFGDQTLDFAQFRVFARLVFGFFEFRIARRLVGDTQIPTRNPGTQRRAKPDFKPHFSRRNSRRHRHASQIVFIRFFEFTQTIFTNGNALSVSNVR